MQPVCQLNDDNAHVLCKSKHHLAEVLGLRLLLGSEFQMGEFADPIDQFSDILAELLGNLPLGCFRIFDHIMQYGRHDRLRVHVHASQYAGYSKWVVNIRLAGEACLSFMCGRTEQVGVVHALDMLCIQIRFQQRTKVADQKA